MHLHGKVGILNFVSEFWMNLEFGFVDKVCELSVETEQEREEKVYFLEN